MVIDSLTDTNELRDRALVALELLDWAIPDAATWNRFQLARGQYEVLIAEAAAIEAEMDYRMAQLQADNRWPY